MTGNPPHERWQEISFAVYQPVRCRVNVQRLAERQRLLNTTPPCIQTGRSITARHHSKRNFRTAAVEGVTEHPLPRTKNADDVPGVRVHAQNVGSIDPRMPHPHAILSPAIDKNL